MCEVQIFYALSHRFILKRFLIGKTISEIYTLPVLNLHLLEPFYFIPDRHRLLMLKAIYIKIK